LHLCVSVAAMIKIQRAFRAFIFVAASMLVVNDGARLVFSFDSSYFSAQEETEENNTGNAFPIFEEEAKVKEFYPTFSFKLLDGAGLQASIAHLIKDDKVRHLAYLAIFSPPPDLA